MRQSLYTVAMILLLLLAAGCRGQVDVFTATPLPTSTPDAAATEAYQAYLAGQTAVASARDELEAAQTASAATASALEAAQADFAATLESGAALELTSQVVQNTERETLSIAQTEVARDTGVLQDSLEAVASEQAILAADRATFAVTQTALTEAQVALDSERAAQTDERATLEAVQAALDSERAALTDEWATLESEQAVLTDERATLEAVQAALTDERAALDSERAALDSERATASAPPETTTDTPSPAEWQQVDLPELGVTLMLPPGFERRPLDNDVGVTYQRSDDLAWPSTIQFQQGALNTLFGGEAPADLAASDPTAVLAAGLEELTQEDLLAVLVPAAPFPGLAFPAARAQAVVTDSEVQMDFVLLQTGEDNWLALLITTKAAEIGDWGETIARSIAPLASGQAAIPLITPTPVPAESPAEETAPAPETTLEEAIQAMGIAFAPPEGWTLEALEASEFARPNIEMADPDSDYFIGLIRFTPEEFSTGVAEIPAGQNAVDTLTAMATVIPTSLGAPPSTPRVNEVTIGTLTGAWTQIQGEAQVNRLYLFPVEDEWLLIGASGPQEDFNAFSRGALRDFLNTLEPLADQGVALGLDFALPEGWIISGPYGPTEAQPESVMLKPAQPDDQAREIIIARGDTAHFSGMNLPADAPDAQTALLPAAEFIRDELDLGRRLRTEPFQLGALNGATASLRGDEDAVRLYLFDLAGDDWLLIMAHATPDAFNAFSREELRVFLESLSLVGGAETAARIEPIGPIEEVEVARVSDGDTIYVHLNGVEESVRIIGVDTPEAHSPTAGAEWLGYAATHFMNQYISPGATVYLESDIRDRDDYQRLLRYVWIKDEAGDWLMLEAELIQAGLAHVRTYDEDRYVPYFLALEREAQAARRGLWGDRPPAPPTDPLASRDDTVWVANPDGPTAPLLYDAAALGNVPDPVAEWPNNMPAVVRDVYYVYPTDFDPVTDGAVSAEKVGYWYWLEFNDFRGWVPEGWLLLEAPENPAAPPETDIIAYAEPFVVSEGDLPVLSEPGGGEILGTFAPESRVQARRLSYEPDSGEWWMYIDTQTIDGWVPLANLNRLGPEYR